MDHRHLLPDEFDLLVDGEEGFGVAPLVAHVEQCPSCRAALEDHQRLVSRLEQLPHFTPAPLFAYHVMREVQVFEPWNVSVLNTVQRLVPRSRPARMFAGVTAGLVAVTLTLATVWIASRLDAVVFLAGVAVERARAMGLSAASGFVRATLGETGVGLVSGSPGGTGLAVAASGLVLAVLAAALGLRAIAAVSRRRRM